jgi:DNA-directed RNA polymerase specialized sigma24 family protein
MPLRGSVSRLICDVKKGRESAAHLLFHRYFTRLMGLARSRMNSHERQVADEEDVVLTAFQSFLRRTQDGDYPDLQGRDELWRLLATITARKAATLVGREKRLKRGGGRVILSSALPTQDQEGVEKTMSELASPDPDPQLVVTMNDSLEHLLSILKDDELREIAIAKLNGESNQEIAHKTQRSLPTIERRLRLIRGAWREAIEE